MRIFLFLFGLLLPLRALAQGSQSAAKATGLKAIGGDYTAAMWKKACTVLSYCEQGNSGILIVTDIVTRAVLWTIGAGAVVVILYASVRIISSAGNEEALSKGKKVIFYALLGLFFAVTAGVIVNYVFNLVGGIASM